MSSNQFVALIITWYVPSHLADTTFFTTELTNAVLLILLKMIYLAKAQHNIRISIEVKPTVVGPNQGAVTSSETKILVLKITRSRIAFILN